MSCILSWPGATGMESVKCCLAVLVDWYGLLSARVMTLGCALSAAKAALTEDDAEIIVISEMTLVVRLFMTVGSRETSYVSSLVRVSEALRLFGH